MTYNIWLELALSRLAGSLQAAVELELTGVIEEFCQRSTAWREMVYAMDVVAGNREVTPQVGDASEAAVLGVLRVYYNQVRLTEHSHEPFEVSSSVVTGYSLKGSHPRVIFLSSIPNENQTGVLDAWVYCTPVNPTEYCPPVLLSQYFWFIMNGLLARMYAHTDRPYSDPQMALQYQRAFTNDIKKARDMAGRGFTGNAQNWSFPSFGR